MKINDLIFRYPGRKRDGICRLRTFVNSNKVYALLTDLGSKNTSASVTNSIEVVCQSLKSNRTVPINCVFIEHYEPFNSEGHTFDIISFNQENQPNWKTISKNEVESILNCTENEINNLTFENESLIDEIERIRTVIDPHIDLPAQQKPEIVIRRIEIENSKISKKVLASLISRGANEMEIQKLIKSDLSIFAELYAAPNESYICFSEFPVDDGYVDFAIFTGRSRMDVFLIEVKGAEFNLFNQTGYKDFNSKMDYAIKQIRDRLGYINRNLSDFRNSVHDVRESVSSGKKMFNSFVGPDKDILVDKNKDINLHFIAIGGRTVDDLTESNKRHDFESSFKHPIKIESWDTFLKKLSRK